MERPPAHELLKRTHTVRDVLEGRALGQTVRVLGWVQDKRHLGKLIFLVIRDGTGCVQVTAKEDAVGGEVFSKIKNINKESAVAVTGMVRADARAPGGFEIAASNVEVTADSIEWPFTKSAARAPAYLYDLRHLSIRGRRASAVIRLRSKLMKAMMDFFFERGFHFISAPTIVQAAVEGGATLFPLDYFGTRAFLSQSAQLYEEAAILSLEKVFTIGPCFRAEKSKTSRHLTEFWMLEAEVAFATHEDIMRLEEELVSYSAHRVAKEAAEELRILGRKFVPPDPPFYRITYDEALEMGERRGIKVRWGDDIPAELEKLVSRNFDKPVFVTGYPLSTRSFYHMCDPSDERITLSSDLLAPEGYGEITTGGQRVHDYEILRRRIVEYELDPESVKWYLELRKYGMPPHSGFGVGVERMVWWIGGLKHIRAASLFPRTITRVYP